MKVSVIQMNSIDDKKKNIKKACMLIRRAVRSRAEFIVLPELFVYRGQPKKNHNVFSAAENVPFNSIKPLKDLAKEHKVAILAGSVYEKIKGSKKVYNTTVLINNKGKIVAKYRKIHLFEAVIGNKTVKESSVFKPGRKQATCVIGEFKIGLSICYDLRFPDIYRKYAKMGVDILCIPSSFTRKTGQAHWEILLRARAIENLCYVLAPNQIGKNHQGIVSYGNSMIVDPWGKILARASSKKEEIIYTVLYKNELKKARKKLPQMRKGKYY